MCSTRISLAVFRQLATHSHTHIHTTHSHQLQVELDCVVSHQNNAKWQLPVFNTKSSITCITQAKSSTNNSLSNIVMITITIIMIVITSSVRACINIFPDPKNEAALRRVALPLQSDSFLVFLFLVRSWFSHWFSARLCVEARRSAAFEAPTGLCSIQGAAPTSTPRRHPAPGTAFKSSSGSNGALMHVQTSSVLVSFLVLSFVLFLFLGNAFVAFFSFISVRLLVCSFGVLFVSLFICLFGFFSSSSSCCLFSINI